MSGFTRMSTSLLHYQLQHARKVAMCCTYLIEATKKKMGNSEKGKKQEREEKRGRNVTQFPTFGRTHILEATDDVTYEDLVGILTCIALGNWIRYPRFLQSLGCPKEAYQNLQRTNSL